MANNQHAEQGLPSAVASLHAGLQLDRLMHTHQVEGFSSHVILHGVWHDVGAGKTHTMEGSQEDPGVNYRAMKELFR